MAATSGGSDTPDFSLDGRHRISSPVDGSHQAKVRSIGVAGFLVAGMSVLLTNTAGSGSAGSFSVRGFNAGRLPLPRSWMRIGLARTGNRVEAVGEVDCRPSLACGSSWRAHPCCCSPRRPRGGQHTNVPRGDWLPPAAESVHALHTLEKMEPGRHCSIIARDS